MVTRRFIVSCGRAGARRLHARQADGAAAGGAVGVRRCRWRSRRRPTSSTQDGQSQSIDRHRRARREQPARARPDAAGSTSPSAGPVVDFGTLSARTVSTNGDGRASLIYQAPPPPPLTAPDSTVVTLLVDAGGHQLRQHDELSATPCRSISSGPAHRSVRPATCRRCSSSRRRRRRKATPSSSTPRRRRATSCPTAGTSATAARRRASTRSHAYGLAGTYTVTLTVKDDRGNVATSDPKSGAISVGATSAPTADFSVSPTHADRRHGGLLERVRVQGRDGSQHRRLRVGLRRRHERVGP